MIAKRLVLIRDDDVCFFTPPEWLATVHAPALDAGRTMNVSVIPHVSSETTLANSECSPFRELGLTHEPFIPPQARGQARRHSIEGNADLVMFIRRNGWHVLQHGYDHSWNGHGEFPTSRRDGPAFEKRLREGRATLHRAFGSAPAFFCPPWDRITGAGIAMLRRAGFAGLSACRISRRHFPIAMLPRALSSKFGRLGGDVLTYRHFTISQHGGYAISMLRPTDQWWPLIEASLARSTVTIIVAHYWEFYFDFAAKPRRNMLNEWHSILQRLIRDPRIELLAFDSLPDRISALHSTAESQPRARR